MEIVIPILAIACCIIYIGYLISGKNLDVSDYKVAAISGWVALLIINIISIAALL